MLDNRRAHRGLRLGSKAIEAYAWEAKRYNQKDRETAQRLIKKELKRRFDATLRLLDDEQTTENWKGTYRYLLNE